MKHLYLLFLLTTTLGFAQIPNNYYDSANGLSGYALKTELKNIISNGHVNQGYGALYTGYLTTDNDTFFENDNTVLDMYSEDPQNNDPYNFEHDTNGGNQPGDACGSSGYTYESDCYNREHLFPQGFFNENYPMKSDIHHVVPTDGKVNNLRGSYPFGEVGTLSTPPNNISNPTQNGSKLGTSITPGFTGTVFEPIDEFKGDIARCLLYFAVRYEDQVTASNWDAHDSSINNPLDGSNDQVYETWYINLLYKWHTQDPVSNREQARNQAAYNFQGNANPFIDHPEYVQAIWGTVLSTPNNETTVNIAVYPNPVKNKLQLKLAQSKKSTIEIFNVLGKKVFSQVIYRSSTINTSSLSRGVYILKVTQGHASLSKKLIKN